MSIIDLTPPAWQQDALCQQLPWELFFPPEGSQAPEVRRVCGRCPVEQTCLDWAMSIEREQGPMPGVYGGMTQSQRRHLRRSGRECGFCRRLFRAKGNRRYCSDDCRADAHAAQKAEHDRNRRIA